MANWRAWFKRQKQPLLHPLLEKHLGGPCHDAQSISHKLKPTERVGLQLELDHWLASDPENARLIGYSAGRYSFTGGLAQMVGSDDFVLAPVQREQLSSSAEEDLDCIKQGLYLLRHETNPIVVNVHVEESYRQNPALEIMALERKVAQAALSGLLERAKSRNVYKGKCISLETEGEYRKEVAIRFHRLVPTTRQSIVLPEDVLQVVERNVLGLLKHGETLRQSGRGTRHGMLLHGKPGTGKTLMVRYLAQTSPEHTIILLTGRQLGLIRESCQIARLLAPSMVILEDIDLIAEERTQNKCATLLHELLDEMDGIGPKADCIFLLTTNRAEILEPALAARPGRIDQAVEFPLPDETCRHRLFQLFGRGLNLESVDLPRWIGQTDGVSPAFLEELLRKSALLAAERGETTRPLKITDADIDLAIKELVYFGGELTQRLLGYRTSKLGYW